MAPVFSRAAWHCTWHLIQVSLFYLGLFNSTITPTNFFEILFIIFGICCHGFLSLCWNLFSLIRGGSSPCFQFSKFLECLSLIKFEHHYHVKYNFENIFVKLFTELLYFCSEWSCTWMGSGHETWILCTGKTYFPISWVRFRINFLIQLLFLWDFLHWGVWFPEIASVSYLCLIIDYIKSTVPCEFM